jgi:hypothetical protein
VSELEIAQEKLLAAALALVSNRLNIDSSEPGPYDDAQSELYQELFDESVATYFRLRS